MPDLEDYAETHFAELTAAERTVLGAAARGLVADCGAGDDIARASRNRGGWGQERTVRAELLRWLCVDPRCGGLR